MWWFFPWDSRAQGGWPWPVAWCSGAAHYQYGAVFDEEAVEHSLNLSHSSSTK